MYSSFQLALRYISYYFTAGSGRGHGIHSPFVFDFITKVLNDRTDYADYKKVESLRKRSLADRTILTIDDYGAGSSSSSSKKRSVSSIARHGRRQMAVEKWARWYLPALHPKKGYNILRTLKNCRHSYTMRV